MTRPGTVRTKRWNDPVDERDGTRILVCRYRPRALPKKDETWSEWQKELGPSAELHAAVYGKDGAPIAWSAFTKRYRDEMKQRAALVDSLADRVRAGEDVTLLCSTACTDPAHCHRTLLAELIQARVARTAPHAAHSKRARRAK